MLVFNRKYFIFTCILNAQVMNRNLFASKMKAPHYLLQTETCTEGKKRKIIQLLYRIFHRRKLDLLLHWNAIVENIEIEPKRNRFRIAVKCELIYEYNRLQWKLYDRPSDFMLIPNVIIPNGIIVISEYISANEWKNIYFEAKNSDTKHCWFCEFIYTTTIPEDGINQRNQMVFTLNLE